METAITIYFYLPTANVDIAGGMCCNSVQPKAIFAFCAGIPIQYPRFKTQFPYGIIPQNPFLAHHGFLPFHDPKHSTRAQGHLPFDNPKFSTSSSRVMTYTSHQNQYNAH